MTNADLSIEFVKKYQECRKSGVPVDVAVLAVLHDLADYKDKQLINKACRWLKKNWVRYPNPDVRTVQLVADFRKAMEGGDR